MQTIPEPPSRGATVKTDYKQKLKQLYAAKPGRPVVVQVPTMSFIMIDGQGNPSASQDYRDAIQTLYPVAYQIKLICKLEYDADFSVMPLEGLWWAQDAADLATARSDDWRWTAMIMQPDVVTEAMFHQAIGQARAKKPLPSLRKLRFAPYHEGRAAQVGYIGPYVDEGPTIQGLHAFILGQGGDLGAIHRPHHEIYLSDPRRTAPDRLKTIIRQPF